MKHAENIEELKEELGAYEDISNRAAALKAESVIVEKVDHVEEDIRDKILSKERADKIAAQSMVQRVTQKRFKPKEQIEEEIIPKEPALPKKDTIAKLKEADNIRKSVAQD